MITHLKSVCVGDFRVKGATKRANEGRIIFDISLATVKALGDSSGSSSKTMGVLCTEEQEQKVEYSGDVGAIILIPGACHGKWAYESLIKELKSQPCPLIIADDFCGVGERASELTPEVNLTTHVDELTNTIESKDLRNVVLVAHSYGCNVMIGAADRCAERIRSLVWVDGPLAAAKEDGSEVNHNFANLVTPLD